MPYSYSITTNVSMIFSDVFLNKTLKLLFHFGSLQPHEVIVQQQV